MNTNLLQIIALLLKYLSEDPNKPITNIQSITFSYGRALDIAPNETKHGNLPLTNNIQWLNSSNLIWQDVAAGPWHETAKDGEPKEEGHFLVLLNKYGDINKYPFVVDWPSVMNAWHIPFTNLVKYYAKISMPQ